MSKQIKYSLLINYKGIYFKTTFRYAYILSFIKEEENLIFIIRVYLFLRTHTKLDIARHRVASVFPELILISL